MIDQAHIDALIVLAGPKGATTDANEVAPHLREWRDKFNGKTPLMLMPSDAETVSKLVRYCNDHQIAIVPQGGNTGLVGGGIPGLEGRNEVLFSTKRLRGSIAVDPDDMTITADAGYTVAELQAAAAEHDLLFPLSLASEGSCTAGGVVSTNAGGVHVVRYGTTRALTLGIEAVLPDGSIMNDLSALRKDNTGYDLTQLLVGAEGTLGIITRVSFKLAPAEKQLHSCWLAVDSPTDALKLLRSARQATGDRVSAFELMPRYGVELVLNHIPGTSDPLAAPYDWYVLTDIASSSIDPALETQVSDWLEHEIAAGTIKDGVVASTLAQREALWRLRETMSEAQKHEGGSIKHDISVPVSKVPDFLTVAGKAVMNGWPGARLTPFGHLGDGNIHFNVMQPADADKEAFLGSWEAMNALVHDIVTKFGGSISAEHGIGTLKRAEMKRLKDPAQLQAMRAIKKALDPHNIMNPGALLD
ncbi:FAD-binding oxidoreductase [Kordiimonas lipolytica]|uniref:FAD-binding oxidoreductase n=1 Tax=Kordiimonas lipolytica TaxID=1662421 RepID=A0ABV8UBA3_9PROT|nr:FAD-binding oxidoreductase [Kordiimonas lipolytica]